MGNRKWAKPGAFIAFPPQQVCHGAPSHDLAFDYERWASMSTKLHHCPLLHFSKTLSFLNNIRTRFNMLILLLLWCETPSVGVQVAQWLLLRPHTPWTAVLRLWICMLLQKQHPLKCLKCVQEMRQTNNLARVSPVCCPVPLWETGYGRWMEPILDHRGRMGQGYTTHRIPANGN